MGDTLLMNLNENEIERAIELILALGKKEAEKPATEKKEQPKIKKKAGRPATRDNIPIWAIDYDDPANNRTLALISMCIKEDYSQTLRELAMRLALCKSRSPDECLEKLLWLRNEGQLGYYDDETRVFCIWEKGGEYIGLENLCG